MRCFGRGNEGDGSGKGFTWYDLRVRSVGQGECGSGATSSPGLEKAAMPQSETHEEGYSGIIIPFVYAHYRCSAQSEKCLPLSCHREPEHHPASLQQAKVRYLYKYSIIIKSVACHHFHPPLSLIPTDWYPTPCGVPCRRVGFPSTPALDVPSTPAAAEPQIHT